ncbi:hypothetical protein HDU96_010874 [Phlyctochytrium bullatum]|nr:hypothetical protein HDU96_010874 [Phlyctochytrium bullatum]
MDVQEGRLEDLEEYNSVKEGQLDNSRKEIESLTQKLSESQQKSKVFLKQAHKLVAELDHFKSTLEDRIGYKEKENSDYATQLNTYQIELERSAKSAEQFRKQIETLEKTFETKALELNTAISSKDLEIAQLKAKIRSLTDKTAILSDKEYTISEMHASLKNKDSEIQSRNLTISTLQEQVLDKCRIIEDLESKLRSEESTRRKLHNTIQFYFLAE